MDQERFDRVVRRGVTAHEMHVNWRSVVVAGLTATTGGHYTEPDNVSTSAVWSVGVKGGAWRPVRNLGWLRRHWTEIDTFYVNKADPHRYAGQVWDATKGRNAIGWREDNWTTRNDAVLVAYMKDGRVYATPFADRTVLAQFLARPIFMGVPVAWFGEVREVSKGLV